MEEIAFHTVEDWPVIRLIRTSNDEYKVQVNEASGYDRIAWATVKHDSNLQVALHHYSERLTALMYNRFGLKAPAVTHLYENLFG